jgi:hypothetical protein
MRGCVIRRRHRKRPYHFNQRRKSLDYPSLIGEAGRCYEPAEALHTASHFCRRDLPPALASSLYIWISNAGWGTRVSSTRRISVSLYSHGQQLHCQTIRPNKGAWGELERSQPEFRFRGVRLDCLGLATSCSRKSIHCYVHGCTDGVIIGTRLTKRGTFGGTALSVAEELRVRTKTPRSEFGGYSGLPTVPVTSSFDQVMLLATARPGWRLS